MKNKRYIFIIIILISILNIFQNKVYSVDVEQKNKEDGIYKLSVGRNPEKVIEVKGAGKTNGEIVDIWNYRKCNTTKILY